jgi:hypothetical protein
MVSLYHHMKRSFEMQTNEIIFSVTCAPEGGFIAQALGHSIYTEADDGPSLRAAVRAAVLCHFDEDLAPAVIRLHRIEEVLTVV